MTRLFKLFVVFFLTTVVTNAQDFTFGKVSKAELLEKVHSKDSSASAAYLYKKRSTFYEYTNAKGFEVVTEVHERIKFYKNEGFDFATRSINLYSGASSGGNERITGIKASTYNLIGDKIEEKKLQKSDIFDTEISKYTNQKKFAMPNVKEGSVIEYKYRITSPYVYNIDEFVFQHNIPVNRVEAKFSAPEYFNFRANSKGFIMSAPKVSVENGKIVMNSKSRSTTSDDTVRTTFSSEEVAFMKNVHLYIVSDIPALNDEPYVNNLNNYRAAVKYELSFTKYPNARLEHYSKTWESVIKTIYESSNFGLELKKTGYFEKEVDALTASVSDPMKKAGLVYNFVKSKVKWNEYIGKYTDKGVRYAYKNGVGNVAEINLMLIAMLRHIGLDANPILISTRGNGVPMFPTREGYNYVLAGIDTGNGMVLLDASSKYSMPNVLPIRTLNWEGRMIKKSGATTLVNLYPNNLSTSVINMNISLNANGNIEGKILNAGTLHKAKEYRERYIEVDEDDFIEKLENKYNGMEISDFEVKNAKDFSKAVSETYSFTLENQADVIGDKIYFSPLFFLRTSKNPFKLKKREFPVDFRYPSQTTQRILIKIPEGYKVESTPENKVISLPDNMGVFSYQISGTATGVQLVVKTAIKSALISPIYYDALKEYFKQMVEKQTEKVVLSKI